MKEVEIEILASDILLNSFYDINVCPITRALHRAGLPYYHYGFNLRDENCKVIKADSDSLDALTSKVLKMYRTKSGEDFPDRTKLPIEDFKHTLTFLD